MTIEPNSVTRVTNQILTKDKYLVDYLLGWAGKGPAQPWGAAHSFALEVARHYGLIVSECDATLTDFGGRVVARLSEV